MAGILISMLISMVILLIMTRIVWVNIIKEDCLKLELHLPIIAIQLSFGKGSGNKQKARKKSTSAKPTVTIKPLLRLVEKSNIIIKRISIPQRDEDITKSTFTRPYRYQSVFFALCAYLDTISEKLTLYDNAVVLSSDSTALQYHFTVRTRLYRIVYTGIAVVYGLTKEKIKKGLSNVRKQNE